MNVFIDIPGHFITDLDMLGVQGFTFQLQFQARTWIIHIEPGPREIVGYVEWGFTSEGTVGIFPPPQPGQPSTATVTPTPDPPQWHPNPGANPPEQFQDALDELNGELQGFGGLSGFSLPQ